MSREVFQLSDEQRNVLTEYHRACQDKKTAYRINVIILLDKGFSYSQIQEILLIDERTINRYKKLFKDQGIDGLVKDNYQGGVFKLTTDQLSLLKEELDSKPYSTASEICDFVYKSYKIKYTPQGMVKTLHRIGYSYKKTSPIPGKADRVRQEEFIQRYENEFKSLPDNEKVYFLDGAHPTFNNHFGYAWIKTGKEYFVKTQDGRKHINLMGAYNPKNQETVIYDYPTLNQDSTVDFLKKLRKKNPGIRLHLIWDNVPYQHAKRVKDLAVELNINLVYLPPYSPNLNLIERYWGFLRKNVLKNRYFSSFDEFRSEILNFSKKRTQKIRKSLGSYIPEKFHLMKPIPT
jgi:transposase